MSYKNETIADVTEKIQKNELLLPAIQRKFVWTEEQICNLFQSIMRNYPFGTFLFWQISQKKYNQRCFSFYNFITNYHERDKYMNDKARDSIRDQYVYVVLDGQQRLSALNIALYGSLSTKRRYARKTNSDAYQKKELYLNLDSDDGDDDSFEFLTEEQANEKYFKVKKVLSMSLPDIAKEYKDHAYDKISALWMHINQDKLINYFVQETDDMDDVLEIFVRVNSGGTILSKTDLLFSTIVSHWNNARETFDQIISDINKDNYAIDTDFIVRTCLYVLNLPYTLKAESLTGENVNAIKTNWPKIKNALNNTFELLHKFNFCDSNILSYIAILPLVYFIYEHINNYKQYEEVLLKYFVISQSTGIFGKSSDQTLKNIRDVLKDNPTSFDINKFETSDGTTFTLNKDDLDKLLVLEKSKQTFAILSLLYSGLKFEQQTYHQDHLHPYKSFDTKNLKRLGLSDEKIAEWQEKRNQLPNLHLLEGSKNESKNDRPLKDWINNKKTEIKCLPQDASYDLDDFDNFFEQRKKLLREELARKLDIKL